MRRIFAAAALVGGTSLSLLACVGDDTNFTPADAGTTVDATVVVDGAAPGDGGHEGGACTPYDAGALDPAQVDAGHALVTQNKCENCHGLTLGGNKNGVPGSAPGSVAYPPNLTADPKTGLGCWSDPQIANAILNGIDDQGSPLCPPMPVFSQKGLTAAQAAQIVSYLRSIPSTVNQVQDTACSGGGADAGDSGPAPDAGTPDATPPDAAAPDAAPDATPDAEANDAGPDAPVDAASNDAAIEDAALDAIVSNDAGTNP
ncbi:MAG TPA: c-type cytochrome [Polyangiaceae bacterium]|jgi:hypothetical protein